MWSGQRSARGLLAKLTDKTSNGLHTYFFVPGLQFSFFIVKPTVQQGLFSNFKTNSCAFLVWNYPRMIFLIFIGCIDSYVEGETRSLMSEKNLLSAENCRMLSVLRNE
jgi:hypothetical protein